MRAATTTETVPDRRSAAAEAVWAQAVDRRCRARRGAEDLLPECLSTLVSIQACKDREALLAALARRVTAAAAAQEWAEQRCRVRQGAAQARAAQRCRVRVRQGAARAQAAQEWVEPQWVEPQWVEQ